jgi:hypothetical protein
MLQTKQFLQERYQLQRQLSNNAGRQTGLATLKLNQRELCVHSSLGFGGNKKAIASYKNSP